MISVGRFQRLDGLSELLADAVATAAAKIEAAVRDAVVGSSDDLDHMGSKAVQESIKHSAEGNVAVVGSHNPAVVAQELGTHNGPPRPFLASVASKQAEHIVRSIVIDISDRLGA